MTTKHILTHFITSNTFKLLQIVCSLILLTNCVNIKSTYIQPQYYTLPQQPLNLTAIAFAPIDASIFIKEFDISSDLETAKIAVFEDKINIKYYNYHQWTATLNEVLTEYSINRINRYEIFKKGIAQSVYSTTPEFIIECKVLNCAINNYTDKDTPNNVALSVNMTLHILDTTNLTYSPSFAKTYSKTLERKSNSLQSAIEVLSVSLSEIVDEWLVDIFKQV